jgi:hypothetical protein
MKPAQTRYHIVAWLAPTQIASSPATSSDYANRANTTPPSLLHAAGLLPTQFQGRGAG